MATVLDEMDETLHKITAVGKKLQNEEFFFDKIVEVWVHRVYGGGYTFQLNPETEEKLEDIKTALRPLGYRFRSPQR